MPSEHDDDILDTKQVGQWEVLRIRADAVERFMPLTRDGLPEQLQGLFWMDQWGMLADSTLGTPECLDKVAPRYFANTECRAMPEIVMTFAASPYEKVGDRYVTYASLMPTNVPSWAWFGAVHDDLAGSLARNPEPTMMKMIFDAERKDAFLAGRTMPPGYRFRITQQEPDRWLRRTYDNGELSGTPLHYSVHRIVDGEGNRRPAYEDYLKLATQPRVSGEAFPNSVVVFRTPGQTDNLGLLDRLPEENRWPAWSDALLES
ncbi:MAG: hypothetical protein ACI8PZ_004499 [Myxococcota bacterium]|jgi:hypothetical protein